MYKKSILIISAVIIAGACKQPVSSSKKQAVTDSTSKEPLYPFSQYIQGQVAYVDTVPLGIEMTEYKNGKMVDSGFISREKFKQLSQAFIEPDPNKASLRNDYEETSFQDLSLNTITFSITAKNPALPLQRADILLNPDTKVVKYVILKKETDNGEISESKSLMWVNNMNFQINSSAIDKSGKETISHIKVVWDKPFEQ